MTLINEIDDHDTYGQISLEKFIELIKSNSNGGQIFVELVNDDGYYDEIRPTLMVYEDV